MCHKGLYFEHNRIELSQNVVRWWNMPIMMMLKIIRDS